MKSPHAKTQVLDLLSDGRSTRYSAYRSGVDPVTVMRWRREDPEFAAAWKVAYRAGSLALLESAKRRWLRRKRAVRLAREGPPAPKA